MRIALGGLGWTPDVFWRSTVLELMAAVDGVNERNGAVKPLTMDELADLEERCKDMG